jgi:micrococcal nuclease
MFEYKAKLLRVVDGDTVDLAVDLGFEVWIHTRFRLSNINSPEIYGVLKESEEYNNGMLAKQFVENWFEINATDGVIIKTEKLSKEKFGRWLAEVLSFDKTKNLNEDLVVSGHAVIKKY